MLNGLVVKSDGPQAWYVDGQLHRVDGPARIWRDGSQEWWMNGQRHRTDGPAVINADGTQRWYVNDRLHRLDGPAVIWRDGSQSWWVCGVNITSAVETWMQANAITLPFDDSAAVQFCLSWG